MPTDNNLSLQHCTVLVTRPKRQSVELCGLISAAGGQSILFPVLDIVPIEDSSRAENQTARAIIARLADYDMAVFVSANAVEQGNARVRQWRGHWPVQLPLVVLGRSSAQALEHVGLHASISPQQGFNSEALLALPEMQHVDGKSIVIFRGRGGREKLADVLRQRGAKVDYVEVYQRRCADVDLQPLQHSGQLQCINVIIVASNESLQNLYVIAGQKFRDWLLSMPLVVISRRGAELAQQLGFGHYVIATEASNQALFEAVQQCVAGMSLGEGE